MTEAGHQLWEHKLKQTLVGALEMLEKRDFGSAHALVEKGHQLTRGVDRSGVHDDVLRDLFVFARYLDLVGSYIQLWKEIWDESYAASWNSLQDAIDALRIVKKFSNLNIDYFEQQLLELESGYPYKIFASTGLVVDRFDCSICGNDIDSFECEHRRGELYGEQMACAIAHEIINFDHVSLVSNPRDKRCVITIENSPRNFQLLAYMRDLWHKGVLRIACLRRLEWSKRTIVNPEFRLVGRNDPCFCSSGKKFKHCCIGKNYIEQDHIEVVCEPRDIRVAIV